MEPACVRFTACVRLEPLGAGHAEDLCRLFLDPAVAEWYGVWTRAMAQREAANIAHAWETEGVHKWDGLRTVDRGFSGPWGLSRVQMTGEERPRDRVGVAAPILRAGLRDGDWPRGPGVRS
jgi:ribosomal-protein-alanine N-acetyltransferase